VRGVLRAIAALLSLLLAAAAQTILERDFPHEGPPDYRPLILFALACVLAIAAVYRRRDHWAGARPMRIAVPSWPWLRACVPGTGCLIVAIVVSDPETSSGTIAAWWLSGIFLLVAVGVLHAGWSRSRGAPAVDDWTRTQLVLAFGLLIVVAVAMRTAVGVVHLPNFVDGDEAYMWGAAKLVFIDDPFAWLRRYWIGTPYLSLAPMRIVQLFGDSFWAARMGSVVLGTVSVLATFAAGRRLLGNWPALVAALLLAGAHTHVHWSRTVQPYIQSPTTAALLVWLLLLVWNGGSLLTWIGAALVLGIGTLMYQSSLLFPPLFLVTVLGWGAIERPGWKAFALSTCFIGIIAALLMGPVLRAALADPTTR
jgi:hypothetical protein